MQTSTWRASAKEFFNERAEEIATSVSRATLCYVSGREQRLWTNPALYEDMMASIQDQLELTTGQCLLEVGCAAGFLAPGLAERVRSYTGVDLAAKAVAVARSLGVANAVFRVADGTRLPWPDGTFDRVICYDVFINFPDFAAAAKVLRDMARVCRPGGKIMAGAIPDDACKDAFLEHVPKVSQKLDAQFGPVKTATAPPSLPQRLRRWLQRKVFKVQPSVLCYYFRRADFLELGKQLGLQTTLFDVHPLHPYRGYRFNVVYSKPL
jgi:SAM-dependent methyltransferase